MSDFSILVVDDESEIREAMEIMLSSEGYTVFTAEDAEDALLQLSQKEFPLVISDIMMPGMTGIELVQKIRGEGIGSQVVLMTGYSSIKSAIDSIRAGAQDYLIKPVDYDQVLLMVERAQNHFRSCEQKRMLQQELARHQTSRILGSSSQIKSVKQHIQQVAPSDISILITGESGTGKELVAQAIHDASKVSKGTFVAINCASIPSDLLESELYGHEKGAFSGATTRKFGLFQVADGGTIFLDEIGEMPQLLQAKLLRTIETGTFRRLGGTQEIRSKFRVVSATNADLQKAMDENHFRSDLYYRLNQFNIHIPPLRKRKQDLLDLFSGFCIRRSIEIEGHERLSELMEALSNYHWPGNVRELYNALERAFLLSGGKIPELRHFPNEIVQPAQNRQSSENRFAPLAEIELEHIQRVYDALGHNKSKTAETLGISLRSLYNKLKEIPGID